MQVYFPEEKLRKPYGLIVFLQAFDDNRVQATSFREAQRTGLCVVKVKR